MTQTGMRHRDHVVTGSVLSAHVNSGIKEYFFGKDLKKRLTVQRFIEFQKNLQQEVMYLEVKVLFSSGQVVCEVENVFAIHCWGLGVSHVTYGGQTSILGQSAWQSY